MRTRVTTKITVCARKSLDIDTCKVSENVQKDLPLRTNESIHDYARAINQAARQHFMQSFNIAKNKGDVYVCEVYQTSVIFDVYKWDTTDERAGRTYAATYKRAENGDFTFGEKPMEVQRVIRYEPVSSVSKSAKAIFAGLL